MAPARSGTAAARKRNLGSIRKGSHMATLPIGMKMASAEKMAVSRVDKRKVCIRTGMIMGKIARNYFTKAVTVMVKPGCGGPTASRKRQA